MFPYNLQLAILAHIRIDKTKNDLKALLVMAMVSGHLVLMRRNQQTFVISKAGRYFFTLCQPTPSATCMYEIVGFSPSKFCLKTTSPIIYTTITKRDSKYLHFDS